MCKYIEAHYFSILCRYTEIDCYMFLIRRLLQTYVVRCLFARCFLNIKYSYTIVYSWNANLFNLPTNVSKSKLVCPLGRFHIYFMCKAVVTRLDTFCYANIFAIIFALTVITSFILLIPREIRRDRKEKFFFVGFFVICLSYINDCIKSHNDIIDISKQSYKIASVFRIIKYATVSHNSITSTISQ